MGNSENKSFLSKYKVDIVFIIVAVSISYILSLNFSILFVQGESMYPTYEDKDILFLKKSDATQHGDIIVFDSPATWSHEDKKFIKRIIAQEGDTVKVTNDELFVNGSLVANIADKKCGLENDFDFNVSDDKFLVMGDNYASSNDGVTQLCNENTHFLVDEKQVVITGKEIFVIGGFN